MQMNYNELPTMLSSSKLLNYVRYNVYLSLIYMYVFILLKIAKYNVIADNSQMLVQRL